ncbi:hypothetical protein pb186bvf_013881 [Paramecium bursaria]
MDDNGIRGQLILDSQGKIKQSSGTLSETKNGNIIQIIQSTAKLLDQTQLNRITLSYKETDIIIYVVQNEIFVTERERQ